MISGVFLVADPAMLDPEDDEQRPVSRTDAAERRG
jgi:hypothetical protein